MTVAAGPPDPAHCRSSMDLTVATQRLAIRTHRPLGRRPHPLIPTPMAPSLYCGGV
jgi:hypothetical protein